MSTQTAGSQGDLSESQRSSDQAAAESVSGDLWRLFAEARTSKDFCEGWLALQCRMLTGVRSALLLIGPADTGPFTPAAVFPNAGQNVTHLVGAAERALKERRGLLIKDEVSDAGESIAAGWYHVAYPIDISGKLHGVAVLEVKEQPVRKIQAIMQQLHWGAAWLEVMLRRAEAVQAEEANDRLRKVLDAVAGVIELKGFKAAAMGFATGLATTMGCDRVSIGFKGRKGVRVAALSHSADFGKDTNLVRAIGAVLDEAVDQKSVIFHPFPEDAAPVVTRAHDDLARQYGLGAVCTVPFGHGDEFFGALTLERQPAKPFDASSVEMIKTVAALVGPILDEKRRDERWISTKAAEALVTQLKKLVGPGHFALKMATTAAVILALFFTFAKGIHRVRAPTVLEGVVQRSISAPYNGYVMEAPARPGDVVRQGDMLCRLDDRELKLERLKWATQREQFLRQHSEAIANHDRAQALINEAKTDQAEAQVSLLDEQLSRSRIKAPFDGIVTSGDFYQLLGTAVERGQVLYEVAPLHGYRIIVQVDERDIGWVAIKQRGELALPSVPGTVFPFTVTRITPISTAKEGRNYFRVEAELDKASERLRPGMEGVAKVEAGRARFFWIWSHQVTEWIRLKVWAWIP